MSLTPPQSTPTLSNSTSPFYISQEHSVDSFQGDINIDQSVPGSSTTAHSMSVSGGTIGAYRTAPPTRAASVENAKAGGSGGAYRPDSMLSSLRADGAGIPVASRNTTPVRNSSVTKRSLVEKG